MVRLDDNPGAIAWRLLKVVHKSVDPCFSWRIWRGEEGRGGVADARMMGTVRQMQLRPEVCNRNARPDSSFCIESSYSGSI